MKSILGNYPVYMVVNTKLAMKIKTKIDPVEYNINYRLFIDGKISESTWNIYCFHVFR